MDLERVFWILKAIKIIIRKVCCFFLIVGSSLIVGPLVCLYIIRKHNLKSTWDGGATEVCFALGFALPFIAVGVGVALKINFLSVLVGCLNLTSFLVVIVLLVADKLQRRDRIL